MKTIQMLCVFIHNKELLLYTLIYEISAFELPCLKNIGNKRKRFIEGVLKF